MKRIVSFILALGMLITTAEAVESVSISAASAIVIDALSGKILYEKNADEKRGMASTTKIMTAIAALEKGNPKDMVKISNHAANIEGSSMYLKEGEEISLENLVYGLMLVSGNDAATAIAEHISGSEEKFADFMNEKAKEIGADNTHFTNPHGLANDEHYTTAADLAKIAAYGLKNRTFSQIVSTQSKTIKRQALGEITLVNHNKLLKTYEGCVGVKTGFTKATGRCLVSAAERNGMLLVCVTLNAGDDWNDHKKLMDYAFNNYGVTLYKRSGTLAGNIRVRNGRVDELGVIYDEDIALLEQNEKEWSVSLQIPKTVAAPIKYGQIIGKAVAKHKSGEERSFDIVAEKDVIKKYDFDGRNMWENMLKIYKKWLKSFAR